MASSTVRDAGVSLKSAQEVASWTLDMALLFTLDALIGAAVKGQLPAALNVPRTRIERIAREEKPVTADTALRLGKFFKTGAAFWMNM